MQDFTTASDYGYDGSITSIREDEFPNMNDMVYLDHTGSTLYSRTQLQNYHHDLLHNIYGNPHSSCPSSEKSCQIIEEARQIILSFFNTTSEQYNVIFTSNATNAIKIVAECFQYSDTVKKSKDLPNEDSVKSWFVYLQDNHTSVVGIRNTALEKGVHVRSVNTKETKSKHLKLDFCHNMLNENKAECDNRNSFLSNHLFAYPAMSNFSGQKYPLNWISEIQQSGPFTTKCAGKWFVLLDAASFVGTSTLDLKFYQPDFVPISFYKIFGFPTSLGALLVHKRAVNSLKKSYFSGGTVSAYSSDTSFNVFKSSLHDRFEDGTVPFLEILSIKYGFETLNKLTKTMKNITKHTFYLASLVYCELEALKHYNGQKVCRLYCETKFESYEIQGPIINFNILRSDGNFVGYSEVSKLAAISNIHLRTGCFCNIGSCQHFLGLTSEQLESNLDSGHVCGDNIDLIHGLPTGSIRISFGYMSDLSDAQRFLKFIQECFVEKQQIEHSFHGTPSQQQVLKKIFIYPIKSCAGSEVKEWRLNDKGLCYDREWIIVNKAGSCLSQKRDTKLCFIKPFVDLQNNVLRIEAQDMKPFALSLAPCSTTDELHLIQSKICGKRVTCIDCGDEVAAWLSEFLGIECRLLRQNPNLIRISSLNEGDESHHMIALTNDSQLMMITEASCLNLIRNMNKTSTQQEKELSVDNLIERFRPNFVVSGTMPYEEDSWVSITINDQLLKCCGQCYRCQMICVDQTDGKRSKEPLKTLAKMRGSKIPFGIHLYHVPSRKKAIIRSNDTVSPN